MDVIVHGGAGSASDDAQQRRETLEAAAVAGAAEGAPLDAVEVAVKVLEHDPAFNAGVGACVQSDGIPRTEAGAMTSDGEVGAAAAMPGVEHAVTVARVVLEETPHVQVAGVHAVDLAEAYDVEVGVDLWTERTRSAWSDVDAPPAPMHVQAAWVRDQWADGGPPSPGDGAGTPGSGAGARRESQSAATSRRDVDSRGDTVGAVAREGDAIAAATSTGGRWLALAGRVGDVPQVGAGFYASEGAAASATGAGEAIARTGLARDAVERVERSGLDPDDAAADAIDGFADATGESAGVILADADGGLGAAHNAEEMLTATERRE